ncbi:peptide chain release factor 2 [Candidatus Parcubacteria bacterium 4484_255]|nr:MAG: peptide chain release factor 2 [Candidatus Parcubacteria bacterium 4484_255]
MAELILGLNNFKQRLAKMRDFFDIDDIKQKIKRLEAEMAQPDFWENQEQASNKSKELADFKNTVNKWQSLQSSVKDCLEIAILDKDDKTVTIREDIEKEFSKIRKELTDMEKVIFLHGKYDKKNALFSIFAGAGGVDAQDWAKMLLRMYLRFAEKKGWTTRIIEQSKGIEAGIKSVAVEIEGQFAYGFLKEEAGVHRLVRISPFDAEKMRHTSFAMVSVLPEMDDIEVEIDSDDLRIDTFLASGHGGQNVQKNETAVRVVHIPTKITVSCQSERSQSQNKERAIKILKSKLYYYTRLEREEEKSRLRGEFKSASWGNQIRSYVLHPYKMVKDLRTGYETNDAEKILDGDLEEIIESSFRNKKNYGSV